MRRHVPFDALWSMPIDVPYSFLVADGGLAWSCGQIALDDRSRVRDPGDLAGQSRVVADNIATILGRGGLGTETVRRLLLYHVDSGDVAAKTMMTVFRERFGEGVLIDSVPVPHYYYEGIVLEADVFCAQGEHEVSEHCGDGNSIIVSGGPELVWVSMRSHPENLGRDVMALKETLATHGVTLKNRLAEQWFVPEAHLATTAARLPHLGLGTSPGDVISTGAADSTILGVLTLARGTVTSESLDGAVPVHLRRAGRLAWIQARGTEASPGLVEQTRAVMEAIAGVLPAQGLAFSDVVKSTTLYVGGDSAAELHDNMAVRNARYTRPGPASTGLPVFGFHDRAARVAIDLTLRVPEAG